MSRIATLALVILLAVSTGAHAASQHQQSADSAKAFQQADKELTELYKQVLDSLDKDGKAAFVESQQAWVKYRDADCTLLVYRKKHDPAYAMAYTEAMRQHTRDRIDELQQFMAEK